MEDIKYMAVIDSEGNLKLSHNAKPDDMVDALLSQIVVCYGHVIKTKGYSIAEIFKKDIMVHIDKLCVPYAENFADATYKIMQENGDVVSITEDTLKLLETLAKLNSD